MLLYIAGVLVCPQSGLFGTILSPATLAGFSHLDLTGTCADRK